MTNMPKIRLTLTHKPGTLKHLAGILRQYAQHAAKEHYFYMEGYTKAHLRYQAIHQAYLDALNLTFLQYYSHLLLKEDRNPKKFDLGNYGTGDKHPIVEAREWFDSLTSEEG
jgi:hypothetical protein